MKCMYLYSLTDFYKVPIRETLKSIFLKKLSVYTLLYLKQIINKDLLWGSQVALVVKNLPA